MKLIKQPSSVLDQWNAFSPFGSDLSHFFGRVGFPGLESTLSKEWNPSLDVTEDESAIHVSVELPGVDRENVNLQFHDGVLTVSGEKKYEKSSEDEESKRQERYYGKFYRSVSIPTDIDSENIKAQYKDGILKITLPKTEVSKPKQILIDSE